MIEFLKMSDEEKKDSYQIVANELGLNEAIIEKDFWVVFMLSILFTHSRFKYAFAFKGGTSLSKAYHEIQRFSEDIDLILDWRILGYEIDEPWAKRSKTKQNKFNKEANERAAHWIEEQLVPELNAIFERLNLKEVSLGISPVDSQTVQIFYPNNFKDTSILQEIRLEIGPLAAWTPVTNKKVSAYIADEFPQLFDEKNINVPTVEAKRTFWEKATILHKEAHRFNTLTPARYSRHYYDIYQLSKSEIKEAALNDLSLLKQVVDFKTKFYPDNSAHYEEAIAGKMKLSPNDHQIEKLRKDYDSMKNMMFGEYPSFDEILKQIEELEQEINDLS